MKRTLVAVAAIVTAALATACSGDDSADATSAGTTTAVVEAPVTSQELIGLGTPFDVQDRNGRTLGTVTILDVEKNPICTDRYGEPSPARGAYVAVQARVETPADHDSTAFMRTTERDFSVVNTAGVTKSVFVDSDLCTADRDGFDTSFTPSSTYEGWVLLDASDPNGTLIYRPQYSLEGPTYRVADLSVARDSGGAVAPPAVAEVPPPTSVATATQPAALTAESSSPPIGFTGAPIGDPAPLVGKVIDYCMEYPMYQNGTTMFTDGTTGWTQQCASGG
ncbi:hypothetical protein ACFYVR_16125 [Rhodococcus sp. NPDC003318]|uniref:hypothetical protein n=1 Tax=Rhodococcus sp. NPDC003318 TaxID=3364503 RepID=UPI00368B63A8